MKLDLPLFWCPSAGIMSLSPSMADFVSCERLLQKAYYYHFVGHCGAFCKLRGEFGRLKCILARWNKPIKNENEIIVRSKQPIKIEKPFQSLLRFSHSAGEKNILQSVLLSFLSVFISSMPSKVILIVIQFMFLGINVFSALLRLILARAARRVILLC